ncbi:HNH endonuclease family protein [Streptosporangium lutulentum]
MALQLIESFVVRRLVGRVTSANLNRIFQRLTGQLTADQPVNETVQVELSPARLYWSSDEEFRRDFAEKSFYWQGARSQQKLVLRRLEESYPAKERADLSGKQITIEHVLPQSPTDAWLRELAVESSNPKLLHSELVHTLGNLTLSGYNSELGNIPFEQKKSSSCAVGSR